MAYQPNDPYMGENDFRREERIQRMDAELQPDPELAEGPASGARVAAFAVAIALVLGAVFYGLNHTSVNQASTAPPTQTAQQRDMAPKANSEPGTTTGSATNRQTPPAAKPTGQEVDRSATPAKDNK